MSTSRRHDRYGPTATPQVKDHDRVMEPHTPGARRATPAAHPDRPGSSDEATMLGAGRLPRRSMSPSRPAATRALTGPRREGSPQPDAEVSAPIAARQGRSRSFDPGPSTRAEPYGLPLALAEPRPGLKHLWRPAAHP